MSFVWSQELKIILCTDSSTYLHPVSQKGHLPPLLIRNLVFKFGFGTLSQKHLRNVARGSRPVARAPHIELCQPVSGTITLSDTDKLLNYHTLTLFCVSCVRCVSAFKLYLSFLKNTVLFCKTNFNLKLPDTLNTHLYNPHGY
jgi:hypothetical protein